MITYSWEDVTKMIETLAKKIGDERFDSIVGISRGGWVPARMLSDYLNIDHMFSIGIKRYVKRKLKPNTYIYDFPNRILGKKVLIVDDVSETGKTLLLAKHALFKLDIISKTCALNIKESTKYKPDFYVKKEREWIIYPWEKQEAKSY